MERQMKRKIIGYILLGIIGFEGGFIYHHIKNESPVYGYKKIDGKTICLDCKHIHICEEWKELLLFQSNVYC